MSAQDYRQASLDVWTRMAAGWDHRRDWMWDVSRQVGEWMVDALEPQPGEAILELASGLGDTGFAAAAALGDEGHLISTDFSEGMVEAARRHAAELGVRNAEFRVVDAERMDLADASVDGVLCRWGYMLMADPAAALRETRRVLHPGGRLVLSVWGAPDRNPWASVPARVIMEHTGAPPPDPGTPGVFAMADPRRTRALLESAGLEPRRVEEVEMTYRFASPDEYWSFINELAGALALLIAQMPPDEQDAVRDKVVRAVEPYRSGEGYEIPGMALNALASAGRTSTPPRAS